MQITLEQLKSLIQTLADGDVADFEYQDDNYKMRVGFGARGVPAVAVAPAVQPAPPPVAAAESGSGAAKGEQTDGVYITSPFVGTFYRGPSPDDPPFVADGAQFSKGSTLCIVEAMKLMNEIEAEVSGTIVESLVKDGQSVEFGQRLFRISPD